MELITGPFAYAFFVRAVVAGILVGATCGALSAFIVLRRMSYIGHGLAHSVVGGVAVGVAFGYDPYVGAIAATLLSALLIDRVARRRGLYADTAIGIVTTSIFAAGVAATSLFSLRVNLEALLFGNILAVTIQDLWIAAAVAVVFAAVLFGWYKPMLAATFDAETAAIHGVRTGAMEVVFNLMTAAVVVASVRLLGVLLIAAAVVIPAAAARLLTTSFGPLIVIATVVGATSAVTGLYGSYHLNLPSGPAVVLTAAAFFTVVSVFTWLRERRWRLRAATACLALGVLAACGTPVEGTAQPDLSPTPVVEGPSVVAVVPPIADIVAQVLGTRGEVRSLVPPGADSHTYEPRPGDVRVLAEAEAYFGIGYGLNDPAVRQAEANLAEGARLVLLGEETVGSDELERTPEDVHAHNGHTHTHSEAPNPHVWMSIPFTVRIVDRIAEVLSDIHPAGADDYRQNALGYVNRLERLHERFLEAALSIPPDNRKLVTYHDAPAYIARDYGLELRFVVQPSHFAEPSAQEIRAVIDLIRRENVPAVFGSEVFPSDVLAVIAEETGATFVGDLSDDLLPGEPGDPEHSYVGLMTHNLDKIVTALGGDSGLIPAVR